MASGWQAELRQAVRTVDELLTLVDVPVGALPVSRAAARAFPLLVPRGFISRMRKGDAQDPLLLQVLPLGAETVREQGFSDDPVAEQALGRHGTLQKYAGRALLITTGACPVHCRYCFRRAFPYAEQTAARADWQPALAAIGQDPSIRELILSGGDPLTLSNEALARLIGQVESLPAIKTLRIHTRFPVVLPNRVDEGLIAVLARSRLDIVIVVHSNHAAELDESVADAAEALRSCTRLLLNQSVLLRNVNDTVESLQSLSERLLECGIAPYYLHLLDRVSGTAHFEVDEATAYSLLASLRARAPGYLVPRLVREEPGALSKTLIA